MHDVEGLGRFRETLKGAEEMLILIGSELRGADLKRLVEFGLSIPGAKLALLSDYVNSRGAADMGLLPDLLPGYVAVGSDGFAEYGAPTAPGLDMLEMFDAAAAGRLAGLYVVNSNPVLRYGIEAAALKSTFVVVQDMFMTETAVLADVVRTVNRLRGSLIVNVPPACSPCSPAEPPREFLSRSTQSR